MDTRTVNNVLLTGVEDMLIRMRVKECSSMAKT